MPLIILSGYPCSGKSTRAGELKAYFDGIDGITEVVIVSDNFFDADKNTVYSDSKEEKKLRGNLKAFVQRNLRKDNVVILDSLNYIKGFRYELFCIVKSAQTPHCVVWCDSSAAQCVQSNTQLSSGVKYNSDVLEGLVMRYEAPDSRNRWDSPLFVVHATDDLPLSDISDALLRRKPPPPNLSTLPQPLAATNFLHELDKVTQAVICAVSEAQKTCQPGDSIAIPGCQELLCLHRHPTAVELQRLRRQFVSFSKSHPVEDTSRIAGLFLQYLTSSLAASH